MFTIAQITEIVNGRFEGDPNLSIKGVCDLTDNILDHISFINSKKYELFFHQSKTLAFIVNNNFNQKRGNKTLIFVENPSISIIKVINLFHPEKNITKHHHTSAIISSSAIIGKNVHISPNVIIEDNVKIGNKVSIGAGTFIGQDTTIDNGCVIHPNVTIYHNSKIGNNCIIDSGSVIGSDGFGLVKSNNNYHKMPHIGSVIIEDDVWIGSNCSIDRGTINNTIIGQGTKIDNLIHIAHNVIIGKNCLLAAQVGIAGSTILGDNVTLAGQVGVIGHLVIGEGSTVAAKSAVYKSVKPNSFISGIPARPHKNRIRQDVLINKLPEILNRIRKLEN